MIGEETMKIKIQRNSPLSFWDSVFITGALLIVVYLLKHIWPFGSANVAYGDMAQGTLPVIYHIYDWLHGEKALLFDWYSGLGISMAASYTVTPFDLFLYLFRREHLIYALGVLVWLKSVTAAFTARLSFENMFPKAPTIWKLLFSVSYALSTYAMTYYTNFAWLDFVILFPLLLWGVKRLMDENKPILYTVCYAVGLYLSFYQGYMITLAVFFLGGLYLLMAVKKEDKPQRTVLFGASTIVGALLSCVHSLPFALLSLSTQRFSNNMDNAESGGTILSILKTTKLDLITYKLFLVVGLEFAAAFALLFLLRSLRAKKIRQAVFVGGGVIIMFSQVLLENTNVFWHGGKYIQFPMRFFYSSVFFLFCLALAYLEQYGETLRPFTGKVPKIIDAVIILLLSAAFLYLLLSLHFYYAFVLGLAVTMLSMQQNKKFMRLLCTVLVLAECLGIAYNGIANTEEKTRARTLYLSDSYVNYCREATELDLSTSALGRVKNPDTSLNTNYPFLTKTQALSNWTHFIPSYLQRTSCALGYSGQYTRLLDSGGTIFSDTLLGMEKAVARNTYRMAAGYTLLEKGENFSVYQNDYALPLGLTADQAILDDLTENKEDDEMKEARFDTQNALYRMFGKTEEDLIVYADSAGKEAERIVLESSTKESVTFRYTAGKNEILYLNAYNFKKSQETVVKVNGEYIETPFYKHLNYCRYPSDAVNGILELGSFQEGETVEIQVMRTSKYDLQTGTVQLGYLSLDKWDALRNNQMKLSDLNRSKTGLSFDYESTEGRRYLFLPISYDSGWKATVNGEACQVEKALGAYLAVELPAGSGHVALRHTTPGQGVGVALSLVGLLGVGLLLLWRKRDYRINRKAALFVFVPFVLVYTGAILVVYVASFLMYVKFLLPILVNKLKKPF